MAVLLSLLRVFPKFLLEIVGCCWKGTFRRTVLGSSHGPCYQRELPMQGIVHELVVCQLSGICLLVLLIVC